MDPRRLWWSAAAFGLWLAVAPAQGEAGEQEPRAGAAEKLIAQWLDSEHDSQQLLEATVTAVLADQERGIARVGELLRGRDAAPQSPRSKGVEQLAARLALTFLQRESSGHVVYAGQYDPLLPLQPFVGDLFFDWLVDTPPWFPHTHRITLVPALRDLQPTLPEANRLEAVIAIVENRDVEPEDLRSALECMLWQWGKKDYVQPRLDALVRDSADGEVEDRVRALLALAEMQYELRDYKASAATHRALEALAAGADHALRPIDWYSSACVHALSGQIERAIAALARCAELQDSPDVDSSHKVERDVFEKDPEIRALRTHPRYKELVEQATRSLDAADTKPRKK